MARFLYALEDQFDTFAEKRRGRFGGWVFRGLSSVFAIIGDLWRADVSARRHHARSRGGVPVGQL